MTARRLGLVCYANRTSGIGTVGYDLMRWLNPVGLFAVRSVKGDADWMGDRQITANTPREELAHEFIRRFKPDLMLCIETPFSANLLKACRADGVKTVMIPMHETLQKLTEHRYDLMLCPNVIAYDRVDERKAMWRLPFDAGAFKFRKRHGKRPKRFLHVIGYGARLARRNTREVIQGFCAVPDPSITLTVRAQVEWRDTYGHDIEGDPRVKVVDAATATPAELYAGHDVLLQPDAYAGYNRLLLEAKACGLPVITTDAPPMNELVTAPEHLVPARPTRGDLVDRSGKRHVAGDICCDRWTVTPDDVAARVSAALSWDLPAESRRARAVAMRHAWTPARVAEFWEILNHHLWRT